tara:strand:- start:282 stop:935 length:654 start_codon:yes stop_codon:yes gene_type:complete
MAIESEGNEVRLTLNDLASLLSCSESAVSESMKQLSGLGFVSRSRRGNQHSQTIWVLCVSPESGGAKNSVSPKSGEALVSTNISNKSSYKNSYKNINKSLNKSSYAKKQKSVSPKIGETPLPEWVQILLKDKRLKVEDISDKWVQRIESKFPDVDLMLEADACIDYLSGKRNYKSVKATFLNWIKRSKGKPSKGVGSFNPHKGGNLAEILRFAKEQN